MFVPEYVRGYFSQNQNLHNYNTRRKADLHLPRAKLQLEKRTFKYNGSWQFNNLPSKIKTLTSFEGFKVKLLIYDSSTVLTCVHLILALFYIEMNIL